MSNKKQQIPAIRFNGFTDAWEQRKLGEVFDVHTDFVANGSFKSLKENVKYFNTENYAYMIRLQDASNNWSGPWLYTDKQGYDFLKKSSLNPGDILMSDRGTIGKFFQVPKLDRPMTLSSNAVLLRSSKHDNSFLFVLMNSNQVANDIKVKTTPGVQPMISKTAFKTIITKLPSLDEQKKIGELFSVLDSTIALHQRQLDNYKQLKKSMKQKIFNQELRFKDADGNDYPKWERRTLGEISKIIMGQSPDSANYTSNEQDTVLIQGNADLNGGRITPRIYTTQITKTCEAGDIILTVRAPVGDLAIANTRACIGRGVCAIKGDPYIYHYLEMIRDTDGWRKIIQGSTFESINSTDVKDLPIVVPSSEERKKIAIFLSALNKKVENHENMINLLKEQKKGLMQQIFI